MTNSSQYSEEVLGVAFDQESNARRLRMVCWGAALALGAVQVLGARHLIDDDGISYLDMGDAFWSGHWGAIVNGYWSPLYPWLVGLASKIFKPSGFWDAPVAHLVNFAIYVGALASFDFFWRALLRSHRTESVGRSVDGNASLPEWAWLVLGFSLFVWTTLVLIELSNVTPDVCVAAVVYLACGLIIQIRMSPASWRAYLLLGLVLGLGYFAKSAMFPMAFVFIGVSAFAAGKLKLALPRACLALLVFLIVASPLVLALSRKEGRLTFGETGRIAYASYVNQIPDLNWQGSPPGSGTPRHPTRKLLDEPPVYEFAEPVKGTYPPRYDPAYWDEGIKTHFDVREQMRVLMSSLVAYYRLFVTLQGGLIAGTAMLLVMGGRGRRVVGDLAKQWHLWVPALAAMGMYALVLVETRYVAAYVVLFWAGIFSGIRQSESGASRRFAAAASIAMLLTLGIQIALRTAMDASKVISDPGVSQCEVGEGLNHLGVGKGDKVASVGCSSHADWARVARVKIVAGFFDCWVETFPWSADPVETFGWAADPQVKAQVFQAFAKAGAKVVVADRMPRPKWPEDWQRIGNTTYYVHFLTPPRE